MIIRDIFMAAEEPRLRTLWRLLLHTLLIMLISMVTGGFILAIAIATGWMAMDSPLAFPLLYLASLVAILLATWIARRWLDKRTFRSLGLHLTRRTAADLAAGFAIPGLLFLLIYAFECSMGWIRFGSWAWETATPVGVAGSLIAMLGVFILVGIQEEILSRGYHLQNLAEALGIPWAMLISSTIFALLHLQNPNVSVASLLGLIAAGYLLAYAWLRTGDLWLAIGLHIGWNFFEGTVFGFPVSGMGGFSLIRHAVQGPELITGGEFGPEAGLIVLPAILLGALLIRLYTRRRSTAGAGACGPIS
jgi:membrane protease YdiL (CAAX protease family)